MKWVFSVFFCLFSVPLFASVQVQICDPNTLEPFDMTEVMVGSRVSFVVSGDANSLWSGGIFIEGQDRAVGQLRARNKHQDTNSRDWNGSHLAQAGPGAYVWNWRDSFIWGFDFYTDDFETNIKPGPWFVIDYYAMKEGLCEVDFYNHGYSFTVPDPNTPTFMMLNTPTRDIYPDGVVNYADFAVFSNYWLQEDCSDPNRACYAADFSRNGSVGLEDVIMFADFWLYGNPGWKPPEKIVASEPNTPDPNDLYDVIYAIVDVNSLPEITLPVGDSIRLYITKSSPCQTVQIFDMDAVISDPNLGWIDCTPDDPNTSSKEGTVEIMATPRWDVFDYYGPSYNEPNALELFTVSVSGMQDGDIASFIYTATRPGDVMLNLVNYSSDAAELQSITIHQTQPIAEQLQQVYDESPELQEQIPEPEWNAFIESVEATEENQ